MFLRNGGIYQQVYAALEARQATLTSETLTVAVTLLVTNVMLV